MQSNKDLPFVVSVRLMTFNHAEFIEEALRGLDIQKTSFPFEVVVGDDFSTDGTLEKIKNFSFSNPKLFLNILQREVGDEYYKKRKEKGRLYNFVNILENCSGKYIALLDGDDYWTDTLKLQKQVDFLGENEEFVLSFHDAKLINWKGNLIQNSYLPQEFRRDLNMDDLKKGPFILMNTLCFKNILTEFPQEFFKVLNGDMFLLSLLGYFGKGAFLPEISKSVYRRHSGGIWSSKKSYEKGINHLHTFIQLKRFYLKEGDNITAGFFHKRFRELFYVLMKDSNSIREDFLLGKNLYEMNEISGICWFSLYCGFSRFLGKGYFFKKRLKSTF